jgi:V-type H+-transporting ATPase subunit d
MLYFNVDHGFLEGIARGYKEGIITSAQYMNFVQCETVEGKFVSATLKYLKVL